MAIDLNTYPGYAGWGETEALADIAAGHGAGKMAQGGTPGAGGINMSEVPSAEAYTKEQFAGEDIALQALIDRMTGQEKPLDIFERLETKAGLPEMRGAAKTLTGEIEGIEDILRGIEPQVAGATRESMVTESQRLGIIQAKAKPFLERMGEFGTALGRIVGRISTAEQGIATKVQLAMKGQEMELAPHELRFSVLVDRNARLVTGFTTDRGTQLDILFDKLERDRTLSDAEWTLANTIASEERGYKQTLQKAAANAGIDVSGSESIEELLGLIGRKAAEGDEWDLTEEDWDWGDENW